ncbi:hypothetical protein MNBD_GAMMA01-1014 [hydrothermal vent metagenome]|uniref:Uncharacterized protein n=1 Tax=hydrothermal vent metagenome TaxID=652676 RepID=A0A3B0V1H8_9ZZZZ
MKKTIILILLTPMVIYASENIFDKMDEKTAVSTGINKLSKDEQNELLRWLESSKKQTIKKEKIKNMGFRKEESEREEIHTSVVGEFNGWRGKNIFKLANGQIWKQIEKTTFYIPKRENPKITIKPKFMGSWMLYVDGFSRGVKVRRIK